MNHSASATWRVAVRQTTFSLKKTIQAFRAHSQKLTAKLEQLQAKKRGLDEKAFVVVEEMSVEMSDISQSGRNGLSGATPTSRLLEGSPSSSRSATAERSSGGVGEERNYHHNEDAGLVSQATGILMESIKIRLNYVEEAIGQLTMLYRENPKMKVPLELTVARYEEWVRTHQRLFELNSMLFDLEKRKFDTGRKKRPLRKDRRAREDRLAMSHHEVQSNARTIQTLLTRYRSFYSASSTTQAYLQEVLSYQGDRATLEAQKVQEFVNECLQNSKSDVDNVVGGHPQNYQNFMAVLCNYIVERQRDIQGDEIPFSTVYNMVEHIVVPQVQHLLLRYVQDQEKDLRILQQCDRYQNVTLTQLKARPSLISKELEPFVESIAHLRASVFSPTPTGKMSAVVGAAKALYDQLSTMGEESIDGDSFLDLWIYVTLKANIPELATNIQFMVEYGNPSLNMDEAGYYLTTLNVAANFIENLTDDQLQNSACGECYVLCECARTRQLCEMKNSCMKIVQDRVELRGFRVAVMKDWVLDRSRLYCSVLVETGNREDVAMVTTIRFSSEVTCAKHVEFFSSKFTSPETLCSDFSALTTPLGHAITMDTQKMGESSYFFIPDGDFDSWTASMERVIHLLRLGSNITQKDCDPDEMGGGRGYTGSNRSEDQDFIYIFTPPAQEYVDSITHRQLLQHSYLSSMSDQHGGKNKKSHSTTDSNLHPAANRTKEDPSPRHASSSVAINMSPSHMSDDMLVTPSPYLVSYSPRREVSMSDLPPPSPQSSLSPPDSNNAAKGHKKVSRNQSASIAESKQSHKGAERQVSVDFALDDKPARSFLRHSQAGPGATGNIAPSQPSFPQIQVVVDNMDGKPSDAMGDSVSRSSRDHSISNSSGQPGLLAGLERNRGMLSDRSNQQHLMVLSDNPSKRELGIESNSTGKFIKSDVHDHGTERRKKYQTEVSTRSPSLKRWKENIRSRFSYGGSSRRKKGSKKKKNGWEEFLDETDGALTTPYQLNTGDSLPAQATDKSRNKSTASLVQSLGIFGGEVGITGRKEGTVIVKVKDPGPDGFLGDSYVGKLEENFRTNHLFGRISEDIDEGMVDVVKNAQVYLQHLNYLTLATEVDGVYSDLTLLAVRKFQEAHNRHESQASIKLPEDGRLTPVTSLFLRQAFITVYASLHRLGALSSLDDEIEPTSTKPEDVRAFRKCVDKYQQSTGLVCPCRGGGAGVGRVEGSRTKGGGGILCPHTIAKISEHIRFYHDQDLQQV